MANDDVGLSSSVTSTVQGSPLPDDVSAASKSKVQAKSPRVDVSDGVKGNTYASQGSNDGPVLATPKMMTASAMTMLLMSLETKVSAMRIKSAKDHVAEETKDAQQTDAKRIKDIQKSIEAKKKAKHHSKLGKIFGWIGVALTYVAAVVVTVASGGAAAAPVFAAAVLMTGLMVMQETGGMDKLAKAMHLDKKGEMGLMIGLTAAILVVSLVSVVASGGAAAVSMVSSIVSAVSRVAATGAEVGAGAADMAAAGAETASAATEISAEATEAASEGAELSSSAEEISSAVAEGSSEAAEVTSDTTEATSEAAESTSDATESASDATDSTSETSESTSKESGEGEQIAKNSASRTQKVAARVGNVVNLASAGTSMGSGATGIQTSQDEYAASMADADAEDQQAFLAQIQAIQADTIRKLKKILEDMQANTSTIFSIVSSSNKVTEEITKGSSA